MQIFFYFFYYFTYNWHYFCRKLELRGDFTNKFAQKNFKSQ